MFANTFFTTTKPPFFFTSIHRCLLWSSHYACGQLGRYVFSLFVFLRFKTYGSALRPGEEDRNESIELSALPSSQEHHNFPSLFFKAYFLLLAQFFSLLNL